MQTAIELLKGILGVVTQMNQKLDNTNNKTDSSAKGSSKKTDVSSVGSITNSLISFGKVKEKTKKSFISFLEQILDIADRSGKKGEKLNILVKGLDSFANAIENVAEKLGKAGSKIDKAISPLRFFSNFLTHFGISILAFAGSIVISSMILKITSPVEVLTFIGLTVITMVLLLSVLSMSSRFVKKGTETIMGIGKGLLYLSLGLLAFTVSMLVVNKLMGMGGGMEGMIKSLGVIGLIVISAVTLFAIIGLFSKLIQRGVMVTGMMALGMVFLSGGVLALALSARFLQQLDMGSSEDGNEKDPNKRLVMRGLGKLGLILLASVAFFAIIGIPVVAGLVALGAGVSILVAISLIALAMSVKKLVSITKDLQGEDIVGNITMLVSGVLMGVSNGIIKGLTGGDSNDGFIAKMGKALTRTVALTLGLGLLFSTSLTLSMFAKALTAFAELENMRVITGYKENGEPIFGEKVNISKVADNIGYTISTFLTSLINATTGLSISQARAIRIMGRALTGRRGILSGIIQFTDALVTYAQFGEKNEVGYVTYDENGNEIRSSVPVNKVVENMISSYILFVDELTNNVNVFDIGGRERRKMKRFSRVLTGKDGILESVIKFSETLKTFAEVGKKGKIPIYDKDGKLIDEIDSQTIATQIVTTLGEFASIIASKLDKGDAKDAGKAINKFEDMIDDLNKLSSSMDGLSRMAASITNLGDSIGLLASNLDKLNTSKLNQLSDISLSHMGSDDNGNNRKKSNNSKYLSSTNKTSESNITDWNEIAQIIGQQVGQQVSASLKSGQFKFEFSGPDNKGVYFWEPK